MEIGNIRIVMVGTTHPGNIGAAARAMHNMCFDRLVLVDPQCALDESAYARASGADRVLDRHESCARLEQAVADCDCVIAASARRRSLAWPQLELPAMAQKLLQLPAASRAALVFGREHSGLTNEEIQLCNYMVCIPANPEFGSLNIACAIQVLCYEIYRQKPRQVPAPKMDEQDMPATSAEVEGYIGHLQQVLESSGFLDPANPGLIMQRMRRLYLRSELTRNEVNILRGILSAVGKRR